MSLWHVFECKCIQWIFQLPEMAKTEVADFSGEICMNYRYFIPILYVKLILEKFQCMLIINKSLKNIGVQPILK